MPTELLKNGIGLTPEEARAYAIRYAAGVPAGISIALIDENGKTVVIPGSKAIAVAKTSQYAQHAQYI